MNVGIVTTWFERGAAYVPDNTWRLFDLIQTIVCIYMREVENHMLVISQNGIVILLLGKSK